MPYINNTDREKFKAVLANLPLSMTEGELNYLITQILVQTNPKSYTDYNGLIGVLECCKLEFYRRAITVYEDKKIEENGDVYIDKDKNRNRDKK